MAQKRKDDDKISLLSELPSSNLNEDTKKQLIGDMINDKPGGDDSMMDKVFGKKHPDLFIALTIGVLILVVGCVCTYFFKSDVNTVKELWNLFIPALTMVIGFVLGNKTQ